MKKPNSQQLELCRMQAELFEASPELCACSSPVFVRRFMNSGLAGRFDDGSVLFESTTARSLVGELDAQYGESAYGTQRYGAEVLYWIGYLYRYWSEMYGLPSKRIYKIVQAREMADLYYPYHSLDPAQAIERICEAKGAAPELPAHSEGYIEEGVALLRKMHARSSYEYGSIAF